MHERFISVMVGVNPHHVFLFVPLLDLEAAVQATGLVDIVTISDEQLASEVVRQHLPSDISAMGIEAKSLSYERFLLMKKFPHMEVADIQSFISSQRLKKSTEEISELKKAIQIIEQVMEEGIQKVALGMTESQLAGELEFLMRKLGSEGPSFSTIALFGERAALPHGRKGKRALKEGDFILIDMGVVKNGYCSDITRTFVCGKASEEQKKLYNIVLNSTQAGILAAKAHVPLRKVDAAAREIIAEQGYGGFFNNRIGVGIEVHEEPSVHGKNENLVEPGMVFTIEPGIYIPGTGGVRIENIVYINPEGKTEVLTLFPRELRVLEMVN